MADQDSQGGTDRTEQQSTGQTGGMAASPKRDDEQTEKAGPTPKMFVRQSGPRGLKLGLYEQAPAGWVEITGEETVRETLANYTREDIHTAIADFLASK